MLRWLALALVIAAVVFWVHPERSVDALISPDSEEYVVASHYLATEGRYAIALDGDLHPPRYPQGFPLLVAAAHEIRGESRPENGFHVVWACALVTVLLVFGGGRLLDPRTGALAAILLATSLVFAWYSKVILAEVPLALVHAAALLLFLRGVERILPTLLAGLVIGFGCTMRSTTVLLAVPFVVAGLRSGAGRRRLPIFLIAIAACVVPMLLYQHATFGSPLRTGYHYWCSNPYDLLGNTFSADWAEEHLRLYLGTFHDQLADIPLPGRRPFLEGCALAILGGGFYLGLIRLLRDRRTESRRCFGFVLWTIIANLAFYSFYFYYSQRLLVPLLPLCLVVTAHGLGGIVGALPPRAARDRPRLSVAALLAALLLVGKASTFLLLHAPFYTGPGDLLAITAAADRIMEDDALIVSNESAVLVGYLLQRDNHRRYLPLNEDVEYRDKLIAPEPPADPGLIPRGQPRLHRYPGAEKNGCRDAVPASLARDPAALEAIIATGQAAYIFVDRRETTDAERALLRGLTEILARGPFTLFKL